MSRNRSKMIKCIPVKSTVDDDTTHIEITLFYDEGGINYYNYKTNSRGYYLTFTPVTIEEGSKSFMMFSGFKKLVQQTARFNQKKFDELVESYRQDVEARCQEQINHLIATEKLERLAA